MPMPGEQGNAHQKGWTRLKIGPRYGSIDQYEPTATRQGDRHTMPEIAPARAALEEIALAS